MQDQSELPLTEAYLEQLQREAEHHGSGTFSCDLERMQEVLGKYQLASPEEYVLAVLAAAVLNGASWFRLEEKEGTTSLSWDGPALSLTQLQQLLPSVGRKGSPLAELAVAMLTARRLGETRLQSQHGRVYFRGRQVVVEELPQDGPNCFTLRRKWWNRLLGRAASSGQLLRSRGQFAPLLLTPHARPDPVSVPLLLNVGGVRADWLRAHDQVELPEAPWGKGLIYFGGADWRLIRHGVTYVSPALMPGMVALWWSDSLPLDLSRKQLQRGPELEDWLTWLHEQMASLVLARDLTESLAWLVRSSRYCQYAPFLEAPLFRRADGSLAALATLRREYREHGWLPVISRPMRIEWEPHRVVVVENAQERQLCKVFANWLNLDHLENQTNLPRLPADEAYVVRIPFFQGKGEAGLRRYPRFHGFRQFVDGKLVEQRARPLGVDAAREEIGAGVLPVGELYWTLKLMELGDTFEHLRILHLLQMFAWLRSALTKNFQNQFYRRHPLEVLLDPKSQVQVDHCRGKIRTAQLQAIVDQLQFRLHSGGEIPLRRLPELTRQYVHGCWYGPPDAVRLIFFDSVALFHLYLPGTLEELQPSPLSMPLTDTALKLLAGVRDGTQLLRRLVEFEDCAAYKMLQSAGMLEKVRVALGESSGASRVSDVDALLMSAVAETHSPLRTISTAYLLIGLAREGDFGLEIERLTPLLLEWAEFEHEAELKELISALEANPNARSQQLFAYRFKLAFSYLHSQRFGEARELAQARLCQGPRRESGLLVLGLAESLAGDLEGGLAHFREAAELSSDSVYFTCVAENLMWLGRIEEARQVCPAGEQQYTLMIRASLAESPEECLRLCEQVEQAGVGQYFELNEMRGRAHARLGHYQEARECLSRFLEARLDNSMLDLHTERMERARQLLDSLPPARRD